MGVVCIYYPHNNVLGEYAQYTSDNKNDMVEKVKERLCARMGGTLMIFEEKDIPLVFEAYDPRLFSIRLLTECAKLQIKALMHLNNLTKDDV